MRDRDPESVFDRIVRGTLDGASAAALAEALVVGPAGETRARIADLLRRISLLLEIFKAAEAVSLDELLPRLIELITESLDAERATLFLHDRETEQLFSRIARGDGVTEIRIADSAGIAGAVFTSGAAELIADAYADPRFNQEVDRQTGYRTRTILCVPVRNRDGESVGVTQVLNKRGGVFTQADQALLAMLTTHAAAALEQAQLLERVERAKRDEEQLLDVTESISSELQLDKLLGRIVTATTTLLDAERSTLFIHDPKTDELWSRVAEGGIAKEIRIPAAAGIVGAAFASRALLNIPDAYADPRFNQEVDRRTGFHTRSILAAPVLDREGTPVGAIQVLNKRGGPFSAIDERRLKAFSAQIAISIQNAQLFANVLELKNYNESILKSLSNGVVTLDAEMCLVKMNEAAQRILGATPDAVAGQPGEAVFGERNRWLLKSLAFVRETAGSDYHADVDYVSASGEAAAVNLTATPLFGVDSELIGTMLIFEDITREKRVRSTMARYMAKEVVERLLANNEEVMQGTATTATVLFSDIRRFTALAENLTARETVQMLNEYFSEMVDMVFTHNGILDKYIGDAIMAIFGAPIETPVDANNALAAANGMLRTLRALNATRVGRNAPPIEIGIGLATGEVLAGSIGSQKRLEYTVIGDSVNLASRLEGATKHYGAGILLDAATLAKITAPKLVRAVDLVRVKGRETPTEIHESLEHHDDTTFPGREEAVEIFAAGVKAYRARDWRAALAQFGQVLEIRPNDGPSKVYVSRCRYYAEHAPPTDWDGVWTLQEK
jgi:adenylate cyclase